MGLFDDVLSQAVGGLLKTGGEHKGMLDGVMDLMNQKEVGGLQGLLDMFTQSGLGEQASSWVGTGANLPISPDQVQHALGGFVEQIASKAGVDSSTASTLLSQFLPMIIDRLTPQGKIPDELPSLGGLGKLLDIFK